MGDSNNNWGDKYDPEADRCCKDCGKTFKTKEGVLHGKYDFHCSTCHMWWKSTWKKVRIGFGIGVGILLLIGTLFVWKWVSKVSKEKHIDEDDK